jgi:hypothetical protein
MAALATLRREIEKLERRMGANQPYKLVLVGLPVELYGATEETKKGWMRSQGYPVDSKKTLFVVLVEGHEGRLGAAKI